MDSSRKPELRSDDNDAQLDDVQQHRRRFSGKALLAITLSCAVGAGVAENKFDAISSAKNFLQKKELPLVGQSDTATTETTPTVPTTATPAPEATPAPAAEPAAPAPPVIAPGATPATPESAPTPTAPPKKPKKPEKPEAKPTTTAGCIDALPLEIKVGQLIMAGVKGNILDKAQPIFDKYNIGGAVIYSPTRDLTSARISNFKNSQAIRLRVGTDEEGGNVQRFPQLGRLPSSEQMAVRYTPLQAKNKITAHGKRLRKLGIDTVFGPVADINPLLPTSKKPVPNTAGPMKDRAFSSHVDKVIKYTTAEVQGWQQAGISPVMKHWPGHGEATGDTHIGPATTPTLDKLHGWEWRPYRELNDNNDVGVMVGHLVVPGLGEAPASVNKRAVSRSLRKGLGFENNLVYSDDLSMKGLGIPVAEAAERSINAGVDVVISYGTQTPTAMRRELAAITSRLKDGVNTGRISNERINAALKRNFDQKNISPCSVL